jgi:hypothetical protein
MQFNFMTLKAILIDYNQFKKSMLQPAIMKVLNCNYETAFDRGKTHCNCLSTWAIIFALEVYNKSYEAWFRDLRKKGLCSEKGDLYLDKPDIFERLGIKCKITKYDTIPESIKAGDLFQIAINDKHHFMAGAGAEDGNIYLFDTSTRPYGEELLSALLVNNDRITWIKKYSKIIEA